MLEQHVMQRSHQLQNTGFEDFTYFEGTFASVQPFGILIAVFAPNCP